MMNKMGVFGSAVILAAFVSFSGADGTAVAQTSSQNHLSSTIQTATSSQPPTQGSSNNKIKVGSSFLLQKQALDSTKILSEHASLDGSSSSVSEAGSVSVPELRPTTFDQSQIHHREIIIGLPKGTTTPLLINGTSLVKQNGQDLLNGFELVSVNSNEAYDHVFQSIQKRQDVVTVSPNYIQHISYIPSDHLIKQQWYLKAINMFNAWDVTKGTSHSVTVAILDTGVNANHQELTGNVLPGYNFVEHSTNTSDDNGHGTAVAGLIAANASIGDVVGVDFNAKILPIKVAKSDGELDDSYIIQGIQYAIDHGADIINMSFGGTEFDSALNDEIQKAHNAGILLVAAAGNDGTSTWEFPASLNHVISVAADNEAGDPAYFSNYGNWIDLSAPGQDITVLNNPSGVTAESGTSFSAPLVSGAAALIKSLHPSWSPDVIEWALEQSTTNNSTHGWDPDYGFGILNVNAALKETETPDLSTIPSTDAKAISLKSGQKVKRPFVLPNEKDWYTFKVTSPSKVTLRFSGADSSNDLVGDLYEKGTSGSLKKLVSIDNNSSGEGETYTFTAQPGTYDLTVSDYYGHFSNADYSVSALVQQTPAPVASIKSGTYNQTLHVQLKASTGDTIKYTLDGSVPSQTNGQVYSKALTISKTTTLKTIAIPQTGLLLSSVATYQYNIQAALFPDIGGNWAAPEITYLVKNGWIHGYANGKFGPNDPISRAQAAAILANQLNLTSAPPTFKDLNVNSFAYGEIGAIEKAKIMTGHSNGNFDPNGQLTRGQAAAILASAYQLTGASPVQFKDVLPGDWDASAIQALVANKIAGGYPDQMFHPNASITRAEFSVILAKVLDPSYR